MRAGDNGFDPKRNTTLQAGMLRRHSALQRELPDTSHAKENSQSDPNSWANRRRGGRTRCRFRVLEYRRKSRQWGSL